MGAVGIGSATEIQSGRWDSRAYAARRRFPRHLLRPVVLANQGTRRRPIARSQRRRRVAPVRADVQMIVCRIHERRTEQQRGRHAQVSMSRMMHVLRLGLVMRQLRASTVGRQCDVRIAGHQAAQFRRACRMKGRMVTARLLLGALLLVLLVLLLPLQMQLLLAMKLSRCLALLSSQSFYRVGLLLVETTKRLSYYCAYSGKLFLV